MNSKNIRLSLMAAALSMFVGCASAPNNQQPNSDKPGQVSSNGVTKGQILSHLDVKDRDPVIFPKGVDQVRMDLFWD